MEEALFPHRHVFFKLIFLAIALSVSDAAAKEKSYAGRTCVNNGDAMFCMVCNIYFESRGEPYAGKVSVGRVVLTRMKKPNFPNSACGVIYSPWQFSWTLSGPRRLPASGPEFPALQESLKAAREAVKRGPSGNTHFHTRAVRPNWRTSCGRSAAVGEHLFYQCRADIDQVAQYLSQTASSEGDYWPLPVATSGSFAD